MKKRILAGIMITAMAATMFTGCGKDSKTDDFKTTSVAVSDIFNNMSDKEVTSCNMEFGLNLKGDASVKSNNEFTDAVIAQLGSSFDYDLTKGVSLNADIKGNGFVNANSDFMHTKMNFDFDVTSNVDALNEMISASISDDNTGVSESYVDLKEKLTYTYDSTDDSWYIDRADDSDLDLGFALRDVDTEKLIDALSKVGTFSDVRSSGDAYVFDFEFKFTDDMTDEQKENIENLFELTTMKDGVEDVVESGVDTDNLFTALDTFSGFGSAEIPVKASFTFLKSDDVYKLSAANIDVKCNVDINATEEILAMLMYDSDEFSDLDCDANVKLELGFNMKLSVGYDDVDIVIPEAAKNGTDFSDIYFNSDDFEE